MENVGNDDALLALEPPRQFALLLEDMAQSRGEGEYPPLSRFRRSDVETDQAYLEVDVLPFQVQDLALTPARLIHKRDDGPDVSRKVRTHRLELLPLEE